MNNFLEQRTLGISSELIEQSAGTPPETWTTQSGALVLAGRRLGQAVFENVFASLRALPPHSVLRLNFADVRFMDVSFIDELVVRLCRRVEAGDPPARYVLLEDMSEELIDGVDLCLRARNVACVFVAGTTPKLIGDAGKELLETYELACEMGHISARDLINSRFPTLSINASSNRLARLAKIGVIALAENVSAQSGGRQNVFVPVR